MGMDAVRRDRIRAGEYRHILDYQTVTRTPNPQRQPVETWTTHSTHPAAIEGLSGREALDVQQMKATASHRIRLRFPGWTPAPKNRFHEPATGRVFNIVSAVDRTGERRELTVIVMESLS